MRLVCSVCLLLGEIIDEQSSLFNCTIMMHFTDTEVFLSMQSIFSRLALSSPKLIYFLEIVLPIIACSHAECRMRSAWHSYICVPNSSVRMNERQASRTKVTGLLSVAVIPHISLGNFLILAQPLFYKHWAASCWEIPGIYIDEADQFSAERDFCLAGVCVWESRMTSPFLRTIFPISQ